MWILSRVSLHVYLATLVCLLPALAKQPVPSHIELPTELQIQFITEKPILKRPKALAGLLKEYQRAGKHVPLKLASLALSVFKGKQKLLGQVLWLASESLTGIPFGDDSLDSEPQEEQILHLKFILDNMRDLGCDIDAVRTSRILHAIKGAQRFGTLGYNMPLDCYSQWLTLPGLQAKPFWDVAEFAFLSRLVQNYPAIKRELQLTMKTSKKWMLTTDHNLIRGSADGWTEHALMRAGNLLEQECVSFPKTCKILSEMPGHVLTDSDLKEHAAQATIFRLTPGTKLMPHFGTTNRRLCAHLGLVIPEGPRLRVGNETRHWSEGEIVVFDDSFRHEVWWEHPQEDLDRYVLTFTFLHPDLWPRYKKADL